jgi:hypothetical protein
MNSFKSCTPSTVEDDGTIGPKKGLRMAKKGVSSTRSKEFVSCCSAAGGLRVVSFGLIPELRFEGAERASLETGANIKGFFSCVSFSSRSFTQRRRNPAAQERLNFSLLHI